MTDRSHFFLWLVLAVPASVQSYPSPTDTKLASEEYNRAFAADTAAQQEEEAGRYQHAAEHFAEAAKIYATNRLAQKVAYYHADLGRLRSIRKLGHEQAWKEGCGVWRSRLRTLRLKILTRPLENEFEGHNIAEADWEISCGDFKRGLDLVENEMRQRTLHPLGHFYGIPPDFSHAEAPYWVLRRQFRAIGRGDLAEEAWKTGQRIERAVNSSDLQDILNSALDLLRRCRAATNAN